MPRLIDHEARATEITEAAWRVLLRDGVAGVSVRNVAAEAGVATASLRRSFPTQAALLAACLTLMGERVAARIRALPRARDPLAQALAALAETMPLDDERRTEMSVYLALGTAALSDHVLQQTYAAIDRQLEDLCAGVVDELLPKPRRRNLTREARHLHALIDGLALHVLHGMAGAQALAVLRAHLKSLSQSSTCAP
ncbi:MAG: TetR family transcriptional regulator C-terminal domain-containing protein [Dermatophilaceae bacterium]|nr:TetR family transcriptional regulator C-terminal domain-containing protein [Dermatophilaceae bacterium]